MNRCMISQLKPGDKFSVTGNDAFQVMSADETHIIVRGRDVSLVSVRDKVMPKTSRLVFRLDDDYDIHPFPSEQGQPDPEPEPEPAPKAKTKAKPKPKPKSTSKPKETVQEPQAAPKSEDTVSELDTTSSTDLGVNTEEV